MDDPQKWMNSLDGKLFGVLSQINIIQGCTSLLESGEIDEINDVDRHEILQILREASDRSRTLLEDIGTNRNTWYQEDTNT